MKTILMLTLQISEAGLAIAKVQRLEHPILLVRKRMEVIYQFALGFKPKVIADSAGVSRNSVTNYIKIVNEFDVERLTMFQYKGSESILKDKWISLKDYFAQNPPATGKEAAAKIKELTQTELCEAQARRVLHQMGFRPRKSGHIPGKADIERQADFLEKTLKPLVKSNEKGDCHLFFLDAAHFVLLPYVATIWCLARTFVRTASGRNRINVLGALHYASRKVETFINTTYINSASVVTLLTQISIKYEGKPIYIVLDNARYQRCEFVQQAAKELKINLIFLPPYSPNLNLIERLWKYVKRECLRNTYFENAKHFHTVVENIFSDLNSELCHEQKLKTLITPNFQTFAQNLMR